MYCPRCGHEQTSNEIRYCSRCGFALVNVSMLLANNGALPIVSPAEDLPVKSRRQRGIKQGALLWFIGAVLVPMVSVTMRNVPDGGKVVSLIAILTFLTGFLRMLYSVLFLSNSPEPVRPRKNLNEIIEKVNEVGHSKQKAKFAGTHKAKSALPPTSATTARISAFTNRNTGELIPVSPPTPPASITDHTTRLLEINRETKNNG